MTLLVLLALLVSTPDGLPPKATPAPPVVTPPRPAAAPNRETNAGKPAAGASTIAPGPCGAERCLCKHGCEPGKCLRGCEAKAAPAASFTVFGPDGKPVASNAYVPGPAPRVAPAEPQRYWVNDTSYPGWQGYGWIENGQLVGVTEYRRIANPLWGGTPATISAAAPSYEQQFVRRYGPAATLPQAPAYYAPPTLGGCAGGQCGAPTYTYRRGFFGTR